MAELYFGKRSPRGEHWISFDTDPKLEGNRRRLRERCIPCIENLLSQLEEGRREIALNQAYSCWKVVAVLRSEEECLRVLEEYERRFLRGSSRRLLGRYGSARRDSPTKAIVINADSERERDEIMRELEECAKAVNPEAKVFCSRACAILFGELLGDWREWKKVTPIKHPEKIEEVKERIKKILYT